MNNKKTYNSNTPKRIALRYKRWNAHYSKHKAPILKKLYQLNREATDAGIKIDDFQINKDIKPNVPKYLPYFLREVIQKINSSDRHSSVKVRIRSKTNQGSISAGKTSQIIRIFHKPLYGRNFQFEYNSHTLTFAITSLVQESVISNLYHDLVNPSYYLPLLRDVAKLPWVKLEVTVADYTLEVNENLEITSGYTDRWVNNSPNSFVEGGG